MPTIVIKESKVREIFKGKEVSPSSIQWLDEWLLQMLIDAFERVENVEELRITPEIMRFIMKENAMVKIPEKKKRVEDE